jgi:hypothetical protein
LGLGRMSPIFWPHKRDALTYLTTEAVLAIPL